MLNNELYKKAKDYSKNRKDLTTYYNVGKLIVEAQGGEERAKYGDNLIKEYSQKLTKELGKGYTETNLKYFRQFYMFLIRHTVCDELSWSHYRTLLSINNENKINYYTLVCKHQNLSVRKLREKIKSNEYERLDEKTKLKLLKGEVEKVGDLVKNPVIIKSSYNIEEISEKMLKRLILEDIDGFLKELGEGFSYIGSEYKIKMGDRFNYIDLLLYSIKFNCYVVVELKVTELKADHIGQVKKYMGYIDENLKRIDMEKTIGIIICKELNKYVIKYCSDNRVFETTYSFSNC